MPTRRDLEGMRAVAVLGVVLYHLHPSWLPGGFAGVDVFFVLSGFFITGLLLREGRHGRIDLLAFWGRRARRLLPAAGLVLVLTVVASATLVNALDARRFALDATWATVFSVNWRYAAQGDSYLSDPDPSPVTHYWSLGVEEQFYLLWPVLLLALVVAVRRRWLPRAVLVVAVAAGIASFVIALHLTTADQPFAYFATYSRVWQLALGAALAAGTSPLTRLPVAARTVLLWTGVAGVVCFYALAPLDITYPGWAALVPTLGTGAVIASGVGRAQPARDPLRRILGCPPAQRLGRYSYSWYLWHWPPLVLLPLAFGHALSVLQLLGVAALTLLAAIGCYHFVEHPLRSSTRLARTHGLPSLALGLAVLLLSGGAALAASNRSTDELAHTHVASPKGTLHPQPGAATIETTLAYRKGCQLGRESTSLALACRLRPDRGTGDIVLFGDSHAVQWSTAVSDVAGAHGWGLRVWARESCPPARITKMGDGPDHRYVVCDQWRDKAIGALTDHPPALVIAIGFSSRATRIWAPAKKRFVIGSRALALEQAGWQRTLQQLVRAGVPVLLIGDNPSFPQAGPKCVLENPTALQTCGQSVATALHGSVDLQAARTVPGVRILDLTERFCPQGRCRQVIGSTLMYKDDNHLTGAATHLMRVPLAAAMTGALRT